MKKLLQKKWFWYTSIPILLFYFVVNKSDTSSNSAPAITESCEEVSAMFGSNSNLTDIQKPKLWKDKFGFRKFEWDLVVQDVIIDGKDYTIIAKCQKSKSLIADVYIKVSFIAKNYITEIRKGEVRRFSGVLKTFNYLGLQAQSLETK